MSASPWSSLLAYLQYPLNLLITKKKMYKDNLNDLFSSEYKRPKKNQIIKITSVNLSKSLFAGSFWIR